MKTPTRVPKALPAGVRTAAQFAAASAFNGISNLHSGQLVFHPKYGDGRITTLNGRGPKCMVTIEFEDGMSKTFRLAFAGIELK